MNLDSLEKVARDRVEEDTVKVKILTDLCWEYRNSDMEKSLIYGKQAEELAKELDYKGLAKILNFLGVIYRNVSNYPKSLEYFLQSSKISEINKDREQQAYSYQSIADIQNKQGDYKRAMENIEKSRIIFEALKNQRGLSYYHHTLGQIYENTKEYGLALVEHFKALDIRKANKLESSVGSSLLRLGIVYEEKKDYVKSMEFLNEAIIIFKKYNDNKDLIRALNKLSEVYQGQKNIDKAIEIGLQALAIAKKGKANEYIRDSYENLAKIYAEKETYTKAYEYQTLFTAYKDSVFNAEKHLQLLDLQLDFKSEKHQIELALSKEENEFIQTWLYGALVGLGLILILAVFLFINIQQKQKNNRILHSQKIAINKQSDRLQESNELLQTSEEELKQNLEELQTLQESLNSEKNKIEELSFFQQAILNNAGAMIISADIEGIITTVNPEVEKLLGYKAEELIDKKSMAAIYDLERKKYNITQPATINGQNEYENDFDSFAVKLSWVLEKDKQNDFVYIKKDGTIFPVDLSFTSLKNPNGEILGFLAVAQDISKRKEYEEKLKQSEAALAEAQSTAGLGSWEFNFETQETKWSIEMYKQFGLNPSLPPPKPNEDYLKLIHPDDRMFFLKMVKHAKEVPTLTVEQRIYRPSGELRYLNNIARAVFNDQGRITGFYGTSMDVTERKLAELEVQKKNEDITASITYAQRIQDAMLPSLSLIKSALPESFIFFKPRDIVSGDFYWFTEKPYKTIIAAVDCTGHGIPGAFMSLIGNDLLNEIVEIRNITDPDKILNELRDGIRKVLRQEETNNQDGMDISVCTIDTYPENVQDVLGTPKLEYAGASNPLIYVQNGELKICKPDKIIIGGFRNYLKEENFTKYSIDITSPITFYIFSDGFQDQFGGPDGRKFMTSHFRDLLFSIHELPIEEQKATLEKTFVDWLGTEHKQIDDVLVIGAKIGYSQ